MGIFTREPKQQAPTETRAVEGMAVGVMPPARDSVAAVSIEQALGIAAVYRSVSIISTAVAQMDLYVLRNGIQIKTPPIVKKPNVYDTAYGFIEETVYSLAAHGNAFWRVIRTGPDTTSPVASLEVLDPSLVTISQELDGRRRYWLGQQELRPHQIKHLRLMRRPGYLYGLGPIQAAKGELHSAIALREYVDNWFDTNAIPTGVLTRDVGADSTNNAAAVEAWNEFARTHGTVVMPPGWHYEPIHVSPKDAQLIDVQQACTTSIARLFGVPATYLLAALEGNSMTYANTEQVTITFLQTTLSRYLNEIENAFSDLLPGGQQVRFNEENLLRLDTKTLWEVRKTQSDIGYTTADELREADGKKPLPKTTNDASTPEPPEASDGIPRSPDSDS